MCAGVSDAGGRDMTLGLATKQFAKAKRPHYGPVKIYAKFPIDTVLLQPLKIRKAERPPKKTPKLLRR